MVRRSHGGRRGTRAKLRKNLRTRGKVTIRRIVQEFKNGESVIISPEPSIQIGMPNRRYFGKQGKVIGMKGKAYLIEVMNGNAIKEVISMPVHLRKC